MARCQNSGAQFRPKGTRLKRYLPHGVAKVHRYELCSSSSSCQNALEASSREKILLPCSLAKSCSWVGIGKCSLLINELSRLGSRQIRTSPLGFLMMVIG